MPVRTELIGRYDPNRAADFGHRQWSRLPTIVIRTVVTYGHQSTHPFRGRWMGSQQRRFRQMLLITQRDRDRLTMGLHKLRRKLAAQRKIARKRFEHQRRANILATPGRRNFIIVLDQLKPAFNIGKIFRSADAFGAREIHLIGIDFFNPAPAMGSFKWVPARFHDSFQPCFEQLAQEDYTIFALDPSGAVNLTDIHLPERSAFVFGHEEYGLSVDPQLYPTVKTLKIAQIGKVQSLNVSVAASVVMYEYARQHAVG